MRRRNIVPNGTADCRKRTDLELEWTPRLALHQYRLAAALLLILKLTIVWFIPVLPCQDLPQHLAYARILSDFGNPDLLFQSWYALPARLQPYFTTHLLLAWLGRHMSAMDALRLVLSIYVLGFSLSFRYLVRAVYLETSDSAPVEILENLLVFNPVFCLGLLPFLLCLPLCFLGWGIALRQRLAFGWVPHVLLALISCFSASVHPLAFACYALFLIIHLMIARTWMTLGSTASTLVAGSGTLALWHKFGELGIGGVEWARVIESIHQSMGFDVVARIFRATWRDIPQTLNYVIWTVLGPYRWHGLVLSAAIGLAIAWVARHTGGSEVASRPRILAQFQRSALVFAVLSFLAPWSIQTPTEATFVNLRLIVLAAGLLLAGWGGELLHRFGRVGVIGLCASAVIHFGIRAYIFSNEAAPVQEMVRSAQPPGLMSSWVFHDRSDQYAKEFRVTHFLPMYYTVLAAGINTQFWARNVEHLPVDYRLGAKIPSVARDRNPRNVTEEEIRNVDWVLIQRASEEDSQSAQVAAQRAFALLEKNSVRVDCRGLWCLYKTRE